ncbi:MAG TPA: hypothetical protein VGJ87_14990 [Roseiflexaceae bacterium]
MAVLCFILRERIWQEDGSSVGIMVAKFSPNPTRRLNLPLVRR